MDHHNGNAAALLLCVIPTICYSYYFFNLEKQRGGQNTIKNLIIDDTEVAN